MSVSGTGPYTRIYNALRAANVPEAQATDAADAILAVKDGDVRSLKGDVQGLRQDVSEVRSDMRLLKWQVSVCIALVLAVLALLLRLMFRTGAL